MSERKIRVTINGTGFAKRHGISAPFDNIACANCVHRQYAMESADAGDLVSHAPPVSRSRIRQ